VLLLLLVVVVVVVVLVVLVLAELTKTSVCFGLQPPQLRVAS